MLTSPPVCASRAFSVIVSVVLPQADRSNVVVTTMTMNRRMRERLVMLLFTGLLPVWVFDDEDHSLIE